jgi:hypothetical protein
MISALSIGFDPTSKSAASTVLGFDPLFQPRRPSSN